MTTLGSARIGRDVEVRTVSGAKHVASPGSGQTWESQKAYLAESAASGLASAVNTRAQPSSAATSTLTPAQSTAIKAAWRQYSNANPGELTRQMEQYGVSAADMAKATGQSHGAVGDMIHRAGRAQGFAGTTFFDPAAGSLTDASPYNQWSYLPAGTYSEYVAKKAAEKNDPLSNWLGAGYATLSEADWNAQNARAGADKARGVSFGVSPGPVLQSPMLAQSVQPKSQPAHLANPPSVVAAVGQQMLSDALQTWAQSGSKSG